VVSVADQQDASGLIDGQDRDGWHQQEVVPGNGSHRRYVFR
jgi:hypothetical protein